MVGAVGWGGDVWCWGVTRVCSHMNMIWLHRHQQNKLYGKCKTSVKIFTPNPDMYVDYEPL